MEHRTKRLTQTLGAVAIATGLGLGAVGLASAATSPSPSTAPAAASERTGTEQDPALNGSVQVPEQQGSNEATESATLQKLATVTADQAKQAALAAVPGTVSQVELGNENGSVVYSVEITANGTTTDVKVDAGNAKVLAQETDHADGNEHGTEHGTEQGDNQPGTAATDTDAQAG